MSNSTETEERGGSELDPDETIRICDVLRDCTDPACVENPEDSALLAFGQAKTDRDVHATYHLRDYAVEVQALRTTNLELTLAREALQDKVDLYEEPFSMTLEECEAEAQEVFCCFEPNDKWGVYRHDIDLSISFGYILGNEESQLRAARLAVICKRAMARLADAQGDAYRTQSRRYETLMQASKRLRTQHRGEELRHDYGFPYRQ